MAEPKSNTGGNARAGSSRETVDLIDELRLRLVWRWTIPTVSAPHVRDANSIDRLLNRFIIATLPCWLIGMWNLGEQIAVGMHIAGIDNLPGWRAALIEGIGLSIDPESLVSNWLHGFLYFLPVFLTALIVGAFWEIVFAARRGRPLDEGVLCIAWIFALILPPTVTFFQVVYGMTAAMIVGKAVFGGTGRYLVSPVILGVCILFFSYSSVLHGPDVWIPLPGYQEPTTLELAILEGGVPALTAVDYSWWLLFVGNQPGPFGVTSVLGCLLGAVYLLATGSASWRIMAGSLAGLIISVVLIALIAPADQAALQTPWYWHVVLGGWAFGTVFLATDPTAAATTRPGRWAFGFLMGVVTIIVRLTNPAYFEGVIFAILLASTFAPLCDHFVVERNIKRRQARLEREP
ncbi:MULTISPECIES: RnfABCDGE type electron transport complex subunit D [Ruegeria]|uniref:RnfABCDGE type electron transport complex subunit D n=1 Tax=Ruegeria TaxID=97050 RepID=UPI00147DDD08|nr:MULTISPECIES: RnfABCDGE type electron transport complex subunit D [Ruegeria]MBY6082768.1 RnfABCDGE type electron transport complex subunit D [Ruegeria arenilitoris]UWR08377.1 RnfABCDGE type electron transport complex subunit D [Ruegeria sp. B32]